MREMVFDGGVPVTSQQCMLCTRFKGAVRGVDTGRCEAFAEIPGAIWIGEVDHSKPYPGDGGVRFDPVIVAKAKAEPVAY